VDDVSRDFESVLTTYLGRVAARALQRAGSAAAGALR
jgi:hypothetical protein